MFSSIWIINYSNFLLTIVDGLCEIFFDLQDLWRLKVILEKIYDRALEVIFIKHGRVD